MHGCVVHFAVAELAAELGEATVEDMAIEAVLLEAVVVPLEITMT